MLIAFVVLYLLASVAIGLFAAKRVKNTADYAVAGRSLALPVVIATTFATWFGAETVLGVSARSYRADSARWSTIRSARRCAWSSSACSSPTRLYQMNLITHGRLLPPALWPHGRDHLFA